MDDVPDSPFDPPKPKDPSTLETAGAIAGVVGIVALDIATGGVLSTLASIPGGRDDKGPPDIQPLLDSISDTKSADVDAAGDAACTRCTQRVPYTSMSLNEDGYFCTSCARQLAGLV